MEVPPGVLIPGASAPAGERHSAAFRSAISSSLTPAYPFGIKELDMQCSDRADRLVAAKRRRTRMFGAGFSGGPGWGGPGFGGPGFGGPGFGGPGFGGHGWGGHGGHGGPGGRGLRGRHKRVLVGTAAL